MSELERCDRSVARTGQDCERKQRAVPPLDLSGCRHDMDDVANLLKCRNPRRSGRLGDSCLLGREVEVLGIRIRDAGLVAGLSGEPEEKPLQAVTVAYSVALLNGSPLRWPRWSARSRLKALACSIW